MVKKWSIKCLLSGILAILILALSSQFISLNSTNQKELLASAEEKNVEEELIASELEKNDEEKLIVSEPEKNDEEKLAKLPITYILTYEHANGGKEKDDFYRFYVKAKARNWKIVELEASHNPQIDKLNELVAILLEEK